MDSVWITGGRGFIGRHLGRFAAARGATTLGIGRGPWSKEDAAAWGFGRWIDAEVDFDGLSRLYGESGSPRTIFHVAGGASVGASIEDPYRDFCRTVASSAQLFEWVRAVSPTTSIVCVSSAAVYGSGHRGPIAEESPLTPYSPYGFHKEMMESVCRSYCNNFGLRAVIVRLFSVYGPGLEKQLIWDLCCKISAQNGVGTLLLGGNGNEVRDWLHVSDAVRLLWCAQDFCGETPAFYNGGTGVGTTISGVASLVKAAWGASSEVNFSGESRKGDPPILIADTSNTRAIGFDALQDLRSGIESTVACFKQHRKESSNA